MLSRTVLLLSMLVAAFSVYAVDSTVPAEQLKELTEKCSKGDKDACEELDFLKGK